MKTVCVHSTPVCIVRAFPRMFYEVNAQGETVHYSPYNGEVRPGYMFTDTDSGIPSVAVSVCEPCISYMGEKMQEGC